MQRAYAVVITSMLIACESGELAEIRVKAASQLTCSRDDIVVTKIRELSDDSTLYEATGCGLRAQFVCEDTREQVAGRDRSGARGNMRTVVGCRRIDDRRD